MNNPILSHGCRHVAVGLALVVRHCKVVSIEPRERLASQREIISNCAAVRPGLAIIIAHSTVQPDNFKFTPSAAFHECWTVLWWAICVCT